LYFYGGVESRVKALRGSATMLANTISNPTNPESSVEYWVDYGQEYCQFLNHEFDMAKTYNDTNVANVTAFQIKLQGFSFQSANLANLAHNIAQDLVQKERELRENGTEAKGTSVEELLVITDKLVNTTQQVQLTYDKIINSTASARSGGETEMNNLRVLSIELTNHYYKANALVEAAIITLPASEPSILAPFVLISVLNGVFLLFPWVLLLLFFLTNREQLVKSKTAHIRELKLTEKILVEAKNSTDAESEIEKDRRVEGEIKKRTFRISEYVVSLTLLTIISAAMWYFFFYPYASAGLANLIGSGGGVKAFAAYLAKDATPITYGFIGASLFVTQMLLRRYFANDLNPRPYAFAVVRILTVFILSSILQLIAIVESTTLFALAVFAFVIGIFPDVGIQYILKFVNKTIPDANAPESINKAPITKIEGIDIWYEVRLKEENIENIQNLATASLDNLIVNTNFCPAQMVDWVDQALLALHTQGIWDEELHSVGIRTATDLLDNTCENLEFKPEKAEKIVVAINSTRIQGTSDKENPRDAVMIAATDLYNTAAENSETVEETEELSSSLYIEDVATLDVIKDLQQKVTELEKVVKSQNATEVNQTAQKIPVSGGNSVKQAQTATAEIEKLAQKLSDSITKAKKIADKFDRKKPETLIKFDDFKTALGAVSSDATNLKTQIALATKIAEQKVADQSTKKDWGSLSAALKKLEENTKPLENVQKTQDLAKSIVKDKPETTNRILAMQGQMEKAKKTAEDLQAKIKKAQKTFEDLPGPQALLAITRKSLHSTGQSIDAYVKETTQLRDKVALLDIENQNAWSALPEVKEKIKKLCETAHETKKETQATALTLQAAAAPPAITKEILEALTKAIKNGPNIKTLTEFWENANKG
jgi:hypothetical protein